MSGLPGEIDRHRARHRFSEAKNNLSDCTPTPNNSGTKQKRLLSLGDRSANEKRRTHTLNTLTSVQCFYSVSGSIPVGRLPGTVKG